MARDAGIATPVDDADPQQCTLPVDRGWAWVILAASFINMVLAVGYFRSFGILFVEFLKMYSVPASVTSLIMGLQGASMSIGGFLTQSILLSKFHERSIITIGGLLIGGGVITSTVATSIPTLIVTQSLMVGTGLAMIVGPIIVILNKYFDRRRGLALAVSSTGANVGAIVFPPIVRYLLDEFGFQGTFMITGAVMLHIMAFGFLFRPFSYNRRTGESSKPFLGDSLHDSVSDTDDTVKPERTISLLSDDHLEQVAHSEHNTKTEDLLESEYRHQSNSRSCNKRVKTNSVMRQGLPDLLASSFPGEQNKNKPASTGSPDSKTQSPTNWLTIFNFALFKDPYFLIMAAVAVFGIHTATTMNTYIPVLASGKNIPKTKAALLLSITGAIGIVGRLSVGAIADMKVVKRCYMMSLSLVLSGVAALCSPLYSDFETMTIYCVFYGFFGGLYFNLLPVVLVDFLGIEHLSTSFGFVQLFGGMSMAAVNPLAGWIHDQTGNYDVSFQLFGSFSILAGLLILLEMIVIKCRH